MIDRKALIAAAVSKWGASYLFGAKWPLNNPNPQGPIDCSGYVRWCYAQIKIEIPEGSTAQHQDSTKESFVLPGDLAFLFIPGHPNEEHHVALIYDQYFTIEARGIIRNGIEVGTVTLRPRSQWESRPDFLGYFRPKSVIALEGA